MEVGFAITQTDDETILSYSGNTIKTWSHTPPEDTPFVWDDACAIVWVWYERLRSSERSTGKQWVWDALSDTEKRACMKENLATSIHVTPISNWIYDIRRTAYEKSQSDIFDTESQTLYTPSRDWDKRVIKTDTNIFVMIRSSYDENDTLLIFDKEFSFIKSWEKQIDTGYHRVTISSITPEDDDQVTVYLDDYDNEAGISTQYTENVRF